MSSHHHLAKGGTQQSFEFPSSKERSACNSESIRMDTGGSTTGGNPATTTTDMILATSSESCTAMSTSSSNCNNSTAKRRAMSRMQRRSRRKAKATSGRPPKQKPTSGRLGGRRQRRLWQLPQSSIDEYTKWIQEKPEADRTPNEERFLWKSMIRSLGVVGSSNGNSSSAMALEKTGSKRSRQERIREFVDRLEAKEPMELTPMEELFVRLYHKRRKDRKAQRQQQRHEDATVVSWMRCGADEANANGGNHCEPNNTNPRKAKSSKKKKNKGVAGGLEPQASLESLRESMNRMGLSSDKLKHVRFADAPMK